MDYTYDQFADKVRTFNIIAGKDKVPTKQDLVNQMKIILEEVKETIDDLEANNREGVLDGYTDMMVTVVGFGHMLEALNVPVRAALHATADNNMTKFPRPDDNIVNDTLALYPDVKVQAIYNSTYDMIVFKDANNKVRKPAGYVANSLVHFVPDTWRLE